MHSISDMVKLFKAQVQNIELSTDMDVYNATIINIYRNRYKLKTDTRLD